MSFNYRKEYAKFMQEWERQEAVMRTEGMNEQAIIDLYNFSYSQFKSDRNYANKLCDFTLIDGDEAELMCEKMYRFVTIQQPLEFDEGLDLLEQIENPKLLKALNKLSKEHYELYCLYVIQGFSQVEIARMTKQSKQNVCNKIGRIEKFLKKFF